MKHTITVYRTEVRSVEIDVDADDYPSAAQQAMSKASDIDFKDQGKQCSVDYVLCDSSA